MNLKKINLLIADDHAMIRNGLKLVIENQNQFEAEIKEATNGIEALEIIAQHPLDIILLDITMPEMDGLTVLKKLNSKGIKIPVLILTMHKDEGIIKQAFQLGAIGYILKNSGMEEILKAIRTVEKGERYFGNEIAQMIFSENKQLKERKTAIQFEDNLSKRELQILSLIIKEYSSQEIADELSISKRTIEWHRQNLIAKLHVKSTVGLVKYALQNGFE